MLLENNTMFNDLICFAKSLLFGWIFPEFHLYPYSIRIRIVSVFIRSTEPTSRLTPVRPTAAAVFVLDQKKGNYSYNGLA